MGRASSDPGGIVMSNDYVGGYAGDVDPALTWASLEADERAVLVDVRTQAEWSFVGLPVLSSLGKRPITIEWLTFPAMAPNHDFVATLSEALDAAGLGRDAPVYFLCRSGQRSRSAAEAMTEAGWSRCYNVSEGFEGGLDGAGHRGRVAGWKARGLPWSQY